MRKISILDYLDDNAENRSGNLAIIEEDKTLNYGELKASALGIAGFICEENVYKKPVVIFMEKGVEHIVTMYGALYSGNFYVPIDVKTPLDRFLSILNTLEEYIVITTVKDAETLSKIGYTGRYFIYEDVVNKALSASIGEKLSYIRTRILDTDIMYIIFTSGSTGLPKGVATMNRALIDYVDAFLDCIGMSETDICGNQAPFYADMSARELFMAMAVGAAICIIPQKLFMLPKKLLEYIDKNNVTFLAWVPTAYRIVMQFDGLSKVKPSQIKRILFSGESMPVPVYKYWKEHYPDVLFIQSYGPTEITGSCTYYFVNEEYEDTDVIPIGKPFRNTGIILLDENDDIVDENEAGKPGEICVYGTCLAAGYYNNPEKTVEAFVDLPKELGYGQKMYRTGDLAKWNENKDIVFISRKDYQVKHMGKRIELGEIETAVASIDGISGSCCVQNRKKDALVLYYIGNLSGKEIAAGLSTKLPAYMIPASFVQMDALPQLSNGKLDRKSLDAMANE